MTAGFQAWTDSGLVQIDGTTQNYVLSQSFVVTTSAGSISASKSNSGSLYTLTANVANFTITAISPMVVLYSPDAYATILKCTNQQSTNNWSVQIWSSAAATIEVRVFDKALAAVPSGPGYGLQVFDENGQLIADARQRIARILDNQSGNIMGAGPGWGQWNQVDQRQYTFGPYGASKVGVGAIGTAYIPSADGGNNNGWYNMSGLKTVGNTVYFSYSYFQQGTTSHPSNNTAFGSQFDWRFMAIDLSNL